MALDELNDKLHSRDFHADRVRQPTMFEPQGALPEVASRQLNQTDKWSDPGVRSVHHESEMIPKKPSLRKRYLSILVLALGSVTLMAIGIGIVMKINASRFSETNIKLTLAGVSEVTSAQQVTFTFDYNNDNWANLRNVVVIFDYPESFHPDEAPDLTINQSRAEKKIGDIASHAQGKVTLSGKFFGFRGERAVLSATLRYTPSTTSSAFETRVQKDVRVASSPLFFEIIAPTELASGQEIQYEIRYGNTGEIEFPNLRVKLDYPDSFSFTDADPQPAEGTTVWSVGTLSSHAEGRITIRGRLTGERDQQKSVHGAIGFFQGDGKFAVYSEHEKRTRVVASPFAITQKVNGSVNQASIHPGDRIKYEIEFKNEGKVGIRDAILTAEIDSPYVDYGSIRFEGGAPGAYNESRKSISWKASDFPALFRVEPGQTGKVSFSIGSFENLKSRFPTGHELSVQSVAKIDSPDIPALVGFTKVVASSISTVRFNTMVTADLVVSYQDATFQNTGPFPPVAGQETTYTVRYSLTNTFNNVEKSRVTILLPTGIRYTGKQIPESEKVFFNNRSNELSWDIGTLASGSAREIAFQIGVIPPPGSQPLDIVLVGKAVYTGQDSFIGSNIEIVK